MVKHFHQCQDLECKRLKRQNPHYSSHEHCTKTDGFEINKARTTSGKSKESATESRVPSEAKMFFGILIRQPMSHQVGIQVAFQILFRHECSKFFASRDCHGTVFHKFAAENIRINSPAEIYLGFLNLIAYLISFTTAQATNTSI